MEKTVHCIFPRNVCTLVLLCNGASARLGLSRSLNGPSLFLRLKGRFDQQLMVVLCLERLGFLDIGKHKP